MVRILELEELPIRVSARGEWRHGPTPLHPRVAELFAAHVVPRADGSYFVEVGRNQQRLEVEDTAYHVRRVEVDGERLLVHVSDGRADVVSGATLMQSRDHTFYCRLPRHGLWVPCRFTSAQYHDLALRLGLEDGPALRLLGQVWPIRPYERAPLRELPA